MFQEIFLLGSGGRPLYLLRSLDRPWQPDGARGALLLPLPHPLRGALGALLLPLACEEQEDSACGASLLLLHPGPLPALGDNALGVLLLSLPCPLDGVLGALLLPLAHAGL